MSRRFLLPIVDAAALILFVAVGLSQHEEGAVATLFLRNVVPLLGAWFVAARVVGTYARPGIRTILVTWVIAVPIGLLLRTAWVGSPHGTEIAVFLGVGLAFTLLFLLIGRALARALGYRHAPTASRVVP
jgi:hypothetical protein